MNAVEILQRALEDDGRVPMTVLERRYHHAIHQALAGLRGPGPDCVACEDAPAAANNPCAVCGRSK